MSLSEEIEKLDRLHREGALSDAEFARAKERVLGGAAPPAAVVAAARINAWRRSRSDRWLGGVCGGLAGWTGAQAWIWRLLFVLAAACHGVGILVYLVLWFFVPAEPDQPGRAGPARGEPA